MIVTVIDSGVNSDFVINNKITILSYIEILDNGIKKYDKNDFAKMWLYNKKLQISDETNHGTEILKIIHSQNSKVLFNVIKILNQENKTEEKKLLRALEIAIIKQKTHIINLSLGVFDMKEKKKFYFLFEEARRKKIKIFCASSFVKSFPASFDNVVSVGNTAMLINSPEFVWTDFYLPDYYFDKKEIDSTSMACAYWTGFYIKFLLGCR